MTTSTELTTEQWNDRLMGAIIAKLDKAYRARYGEDLPRKAPGKGGVNPGAMERALAVAKANPRLTPAQVAHDAKCGHSTAELAMKSLGIASPRQKAREARQRLLDVIAQNPDAGKRKIAKLTGHAQGYITEVLAWERRKAKRKSRARGAGE